MNHSMAVAAKALLREQEKGFLRNEKTSNIDGFIHFKSEQLTSLALWNGQLKRRAIYLPP